MPIIETVVPVDGKNLSDFALAICCCWIFSVEVSLCVEEGAACPESSFGLESPL